MSFRAFQAKGIQRQAETKAVTEAMTAAHECVSRNLKDIQKLSKEQIAILFFLHGYNENMRNGFNLQQTIDHAMRYGGLPARPKGWG